LGRLEHFGVKLGLERMRSLLGALGDPHLAVPSVLVAGTNGKGSTASLVASMARAAGYRAGLFISPHLEDPRERISLDGVAISDDSLAAAIETAIGEAETLGVELPTYFEAFTLSAMQYFRGAGVDLAVYEVGLGGRLDATNTTEPLISVVTSIALDHQRLLGDTLALVAGEKSGIFRSGRPAIVWGDEPEVWRVFVERAEATGARLVRAEERVEIEPLGIEVAASGPPLQRVALRTRRDRYRLELALAGEHQLRNLALAVLAAEELVDAGFGALGRREVVAGVGACRWPGRLEWIEPVDGPRVLLDGAHNPAGAQALCRYLDSLDLQPVLLFGVLGDKKVPEMLPPLARRSGRVILTRPPGNRAVPPGELAGWVEGTPVEVVEDSVQALERGLEGAREEGVPLLICGSLYLVGELRPVLRRLYGVPAATV
jgi:dihydrofolate synthase/folylpolyglutamate synthase